MVLLLLEAPPMVPFYRPAMPKLETRAAALDYARRVRLTLASLRARVREGWIIQEDVFVADRWAFERALGKARALPAPRLPG